MTKVYLQLLIDLIAIEPIFSPNSVLVFISECKSDFDFTLRWIPLGK